MRKVILSVISFLTILPLFSQQSLFHSYNEGNSVVSVNSSTDEVTDLTFTLGKIFSKTIPGQGLRFSLDNGTPMEILGSPDLPQFASSIIIPDLASMKIELISADFVDYSNIEVAPSKGTLVRTVDPSSIPFTKGPQYSADQWFPANVSDLQHPYIVRDFRAQTVLFHPLQYNAVTKVLRIYNSIHIRISVQDQEGENPFVRSNSEPIEKEFDKIYSNRFVNYGSTSRYTPVEENGSMLIITHPLFAEPMQPFVKWKIERGIRTEMVTTNATGTTSSEIKTFVQNYYNTHPELKYLLIVGDAPQVPPQDPNGSNGLAGPSDNFYGYLTGNDAYPEIFVGRFSAEITADVITQVERMIKYEKNPDPGDWYAKGCGLASNQGPGDDNEMDYEHEQNLRAELLGFTYTQIDEFYDGSQGGQDAPNDPTAVMISNAINDGRGIINYTGHGWNGGWATSGFSSTEANNLQNTNKLPFVISVGCVNGEFMNLTCFAEYWMRSTDGNGAPVGAIGTMMSTINQYWNQPMEAQDEMVNILTESSSSNIKRTFGGISMNGCMKMNDSYGSSGDDMTDTWVLFGDPSLLVRTAQPSPMITTHVSEVQVGTSSATITCNTEGAFICLSMNDTILGTGTVSGGNVIINFPAVTQEDTMTVTATAFNKAPYQGNIRVKENFAGINETTNGSFTAYPNPSKDWLYVQRTASGNTDFSWTITDIAGRVILQQQTQTGSEFSINVSAIQTGNYFLNITENGKIFSNKFIVVH